MRLGLALHKSREEIRALPAPEYRDWELFYLLEPWGWQNTEYLVGKVMSGIFDIAAKGKKSFLPKQFMRDFYKDLTEPTEAEIIKYRKEHSRDELIAMAKRDMGVK